MDNNSDMKTPYEVRPEGTSTILSQLAMLHLQSAGYYRDIHAALDGELEQDDTSADYFSTLAEYHDGMLKQINQVIEDMAAGVNTPSREGETILKSKEAEMNRAIQSKNVVELATLAYENEQSISESYEHALANDKLLDFAEEMLHKQHQKHLVWVNRADRYKTIPQQFNDHYEED